MTLSFLLQNVETVNRVTSDQCPAEERDTRLKDLKVHLPGEDACANLVQSVTHMRLVNCVLLFMTCLRLVCSHCACGLVCHRKALAFLRANRVGGTSCWTVGQTLHFCGVDVERLDDGGLRLHQKRCVGLVG